jgi:hypothetical protein
MLTSPWVNQHQTHVGTMVKKIPKNPIKLFQNIREEKFTPIRLNQIQHFFGASYGRHLQTSLKTMKKKKKKKKKVVPTY